MHVEISWQAMLNLTAVLAVTCEICFFLSRDLDVFLSLGGFFAILMVNDETDNHGFQRSICI